MLSKPFNSTDLQQFIDEHQLAATILPMAEHTPTVPDAARVLGVETGQIIKSLVFMVYDEPLLVINNGLAKVDRRRIAAHLEVGRKKVKFATAEQALQITGYIVGSMPPFGHRQPLRTLVDLTVPDLEIVYGGGGVLDAMMRLTTTELLQVTQAETLALSEI